MHDRKVPNDITNMLWLKWLMIFKKAHLPIWNINKRILDTQIDQVSCQKLLGVILDENLNYETHIDHLCKKLSKQLGLLKHIGAYLKRRQREIYFNGVIKPTLMYGSVIWDCCSVESLTRVLKLQKRAARIISDTKKTTSSIFLFNILIGYLLQRSLWSKELLWLLKSECLLLYS